MIGEDLNLDDDDEFCVGSSSADMSTSGFNVVGYRIVIGTSSVNVINFTNRRLM